MRYRIAGPNIQNDPNDWYDVCDRTVRIWDDGTNNWATIQLGADPINIRLTDNSWKVLDCTYPCGFESEFTTVGAYLVNPYVIEIDTGSATGFIAVEVDAFTIPDKFDFFYNGSTITSGWIGNKNKIGSNYTSNATVPSSVNGTRQLGYHCMQINKTTASPNIAELRCFSAFSSSGFKGRMLCPSPTSLTSLRETVIEYLGLTPINFVHLCRVEIDGKVRGQTLVGNEQYASEQRQIRLYADTEGSAPEEAVLNGSLLVSGNDWQQFRTLSTSVLNSIAFDFKQTLPNNTLITLDIRQLPLNNIIYTASKNQSEYVTGLSNNNTFRFDPNINIDTGLRIQLIVETFEI